MIAAIGAGKELAGVGSDVHAAGILDIGGKGVPEDTQHHIRPRGQSIGERFPLFSSVGGAIDGESMSSVMSTFTILNDCIDGVGMVGIQGNRETEFGRKIVLDIDPVFTGVGSFVDAAVVLLIEHIWSAGMLDDAVNALAVFGLDVRLETGACIAIGKCPGGSAIIGARASHG